MGRTTGSAVAFNSVISGPHQFVVLASHDCQKSVCQSYVCMRRHPMSQLEIDSRPRFFPRVTRVVTLLATLCCLHGAAVHARKSNSVQSTEKKVESQVRA